MLIDGTESDFLFLTDDVLCQRIEGICFEGIQWPTQKNQQKLQFILRHIHRLSNRHRPQQIPKL